MMEKLYIVEQSYNGDVSDRYYTSNAVKAKEKFEHSKRELIDKFQDKLISEFPIEVQDTENYKEFILHVGYSHTHEVTLTVAEMEK